jgi:hypothetical protein
MILKGVTKMRYGEKEAQTLTYSYNDIGSKSPNAHGIYDPGWSMHYTEIRHDDKPIISTWEISAILLAISMILMIISRVL